MVILSLTCDSLGACVHFQLALRWHQLSFVTLWKCRVLKLDFTCTDYCLLPTNSTCIYCHAVLHGSPYIFM